MPALHAVPATPLPVAPLARGTVDVAGTILEVRSLTRGEQLHLLELKDGPDADHMGEVFMIACGTDRSLEEAETWWDTTDPVVVHGLVLGIAIVSRLAVRKAGPDPKRKRSARSSTASST
jgi:hypothetical protein